MPHDITPENVSSAGKALADIFGGGDGISPGRIWTGKKPAEKRAGCKTFAGRFENIGTATKGLERACAEAASEARETGATILDPPTWDGKQTFPQFEESCQDYCFYAWDFTEGKSRRVEAPAAPPAQPELPKPLPPYSAPGESYFPSRDHCRFDNLPHLEARIERLRFEIARMGGGTMKELEPRGYAQCFESHARFAWQYTRELSAHLATLLDRHPDQKLAAQVRLHNISKTL